MARTIPERYVWAVDVLDVQPTDEILEIGCGFGHSTRLICEKLQHGHFTAIDRSGKMIAAAMRANQEFISSSQVQLLHTDLLDRGLPASYFDKIFLFNVNAFWMDPVAELDEIRRLLKPTGRFFIFHQPPPGHDLDEFDNAFQTNLAENDFHLVSAFKDVTEAIRSVAVISTLIPR